MHVELKLVDLSQLRFLIIDKHTLRSPENEDESLNSILHGMLVKMK